MKMKIALFSCVLAFLFGLCSFSYADSEVMPYKNIKWDISDNGLLTISGAGKIHDTEYDLEQRKVLVQPPWLEDDIRYKIKEVIVNEGIVYIGKGAFSNCEGLQKITLPESVSELGEGAFAACRQLASIVIPSKVKTIPKRCFADNINLRYISLPEGLTSIEYGAFYWCDNLAYIELPDSLKNIGEDVFSENLKLKEIRIPRDVTSIPDYAFAKCPELERAELPPALKTVGTCAFEGNKSLTEIYLPDGVEEIGECAFAKCYQLEKLYIPESVKAIGKEIFLISDKAVIYGFKDSYAEKYAMDNNLKFEAVTESMYTEPDYSVKRFLKPEDIPNANEKKPVISVTSINGQLDISIEGSPVEFTDAVPFIDENARTLVPVRSVFESIGCDVRYDEVLQAVNIVGKNTIIMISPGVKTIIVDYSAFPIDTEAQILNDRIFLPLRCIAEALKYEVEWKDL
ncbi:MAG: leucine-rich repeat protein [Clostridia bacterium]|nr:leucine-rich repeat protein [Clostridia bacterium]